VIDILKREIAGAPRFIPLMTGLLLVVVSELLTSDPVRVALQILGLVVLAGWAAWRQKLVETEQHPLVSALVILAVIAGLGLLVLI
jgi:hypothetical protein